jgi:phosphopantothenoylcysteine decarboxylase/phosphopantothenate--cysteine ligase
MAQGNSDNLLLATYLSARCPVIVAPAMDLDMFAHPATQKNLDIISAYGNKIIPPNNGELASGLIGAGRMAEPEEIFDFVLAQTQIKLPLQGIEVLITAGPTYEAIDPVRFIGNHSSGKMGFALAEVFSNLGARVTLIAGPSHLKLANNLVQRINVISASEMFNAVMQHHSKAKILIMAAAVADYTPALVSSQKIKKSSDDMKIDLVQTKDILKEIGKLKLPHQILVGFALETDNEEANALKKLKEKNLDFIVLNSLKNEKTGFGYDTNQIQILEKNGAITHFDLKLKQQVAVDIADKIIELINA